MIWRQFVKWSLLPRLRSRHFQHDLQENKNIWVENETKKYVFPRNKNTPKYHFSSTLSTLVKTFHLKIYYSFNCFRTRAPIFRRVTLSRFSLAHNGRGSISRRQPTSASREGVYWKKNIFFSSKLYSKREKH